MVHCGYSTCVRGLKMWLLERTEIIRSGLRMYVGAKVGIASYYPLGAYAYNKLFEMSSPAVQSGWRRALVGHSSFSVGERLDTARW